MASRVGDPRSQEDAVAIIGLALWIATFCHVILVFSTHSVIPLHGKKNTAIRSTGSNTHTHSEQTTTARAEAKDNSNPLPFFFFLPFRLLDGLCEKCRIASSTPNLPLPRSPVPNPTPKTPDRSERCCRHSLDHLRRRPRLRKFRDQRPQQRPWDHHPTIMAARMRLCWSRSRASSSS